MMIDRHSLSRVLKNAAQDDDDAGRLMILLQGLYFTVNHIS
jgi:hypothetical protein